MLNTEFIFWLSFTGVVYAYFGYPIALWLLGKLKTKEKIFSDGDFTPSVSIIIPAHNEERVIAEKLQNTFQLEYPGESIELIIVSDGSTDQTANIAQQANGPIDIRFFELKERGGKAAALNLGLEKSDSEIIVFSDSSIMLDKEAIRNIVKPFQDKCIGCVSGEDHIREGSGEGAYGKYELFLRNQESKVYSIVGASGSFYAQRKSLVAPFIEGVAPDFLSVLNVAEQGYRSVTEPSAFGEMESVKSVQGEFQRKIRTFIRGMSALFLKKNLMNPFRYGIFSFLLISHKLIRWLVPFFLMLLFLSNAFILDGVFYFTVMFSQVTFYILALLTYMNDNLSNKLYGKIPLYFSIVNIAIFIAWFKYIMGVRQEIWDPSNRKIKS